MPRAPVLLIGLLGVGLSISCRDGNGSAKKPVEAGFARDASTALVVLVPQNRQEELADKMRQARTRQSAAQRSPLQEIILEGQDAAASVDAARSTRKR